MKMAGAVGGSVRRGGVPREVVQVVDEPRVLQQGALGATCGPAGEDDVGQAVGVAAPLGGPLAGVGRDLVPVGVQVDPLGCGGEGDVGVDA